MKHTTENIAVLDHGIRLAGILERPSAEPGPLVIVLHGFTSAKERPHTVAACEAMREAGFATLRFDLYGHGESGGEFRKHTLDKWISNTLAMVGYAEGLDFVTEIWLSGHSQGGLTAALAAGREPERVKGLILRAPAFMIPRCAREGNMLGVRFDPAHIPEAFPTIKGLTLEAGYVRSAQAICVEDAIDAFPGPVLLLQGAADELVPLQDVEAAAKRYRNCTLELIPGETHHFDRVPERMKTVIRSWLAPYGPGAPAARQTPSREGTADKRLKPYLDCISVENMRESDRRTIAHFCPGRTLMYRAALGVYRAAGWDGMTAIAVGGGNNGGDGYALACILARNSQRCRIVKLSEKLTEDSGYYAAQAAALGVPMAVYAPGAFADCDTVVDCLLGTGFQGSLREPWLGAVEEINACGARVVSVDINSGMNGDTGEAETAVRSDLTVTVGYVKRGLVTEQAGRYMKRLVVADIGIVLVRQEARIAVGEAAESGAGLLPCPPWLDRSPIDVREASEEDLS